MPSLALTVHLGQLLEDAEQLLRAQVALRRTPGTRAMSMALYRASVVLCVSAWESFVEELLREAVAAIRPAAPPLGMWPALNATARSAVGRFNTPNTEQVRSLFSDAIGLQDVQAAWEWQRSTVADARERLQEMMEYRHQIAHGVNPRPDIDAPFARELPLFLRRLARSTDAAVRAYLTGALGVAEPWPE